MNYKNYIGLEKQYENIGKIIFDLLKEHGLKKNSKVLDIGCGSLRIGQHLINYLNSGNYYGIEPNKWLVEEALENENIKRNKKFKIENNNDFNINFDINFNFIIANSIFIHATKQQIRTCIENVLNKLNGKFIFNFIEGPDCNKKDWTYPGIVTYSKKYIESLLKGYNYKYIKCNYPGKQIFILIEKKNKENINSM